MLKRRVIIFLVLVLTGLISACGRNAKFCEEEAEELAVETRQSLESSEGPWEISIRNRNVLIDEIVHGPLCDADWNGTVYVDCDVTVPEWDRDGKPVFFDNCDLNIAPDTVVYVAFHNEEAYYKGCSCHFTE